MGVAPQAGASSSSGVAVGSRVVVSAALSKHFAKKGVVVKTKDKKCKVVFDGKDDAVSPEPYARTASCCAVYGRVSRTRSTWSSATTCSRSRPF